MYTVRKLAAILFADIVGYTSLMQHDEQTASTLLRHFQKQLEEKVKAHHGRIVNFYGDGALCTFPIPIDAVRCAMALQTTFSDPPKTPVRIGIHSGTVTLEGEKIFGDSVNLASRIESLGMTGAILISKKVRDEVKNNPDLKLQSLGSFEFKNVNEPMEVFALANEGFAIPTRKKMQGKLSTPYSLSKSQIWIPFSIALLVVPLIYFFVKFSKVDSEVEKEDTAQPLTRAIISKNSIAVLPFLNMNKEPDSDYFSDGIMEDILTNLAKIPELKVISRTSAMRYKGSQKSVPEIAAELGVRYILEGSVRKYDDNIRITAQLIKAGEDIHLWAENYDRTMENVFSIQSEVSKSIADQLKITISPEVETLLNAIPTDNMQAYDLYIRGRQILQNRTYEDIKKSIQLFEKAIELDPKFAHAIAELGNCYHLYYHYGYEDQNSSAKKANELSRKALSIDQNIARAHNLLGVSPIEVGRDSFIFKTLAAFKKGLQANPNDIQLLHHTAFLFIPMQRFQEATTFAKKALELDPYSPIAHANFLRVLIYTRQFEPARKHLQEALELFPNSFLIKKRQQELLYFQGKCRQLKEQLDEWNTGEDEASSIVFYSKKGLCYCYAAEQNRDKTEEFNCEDEWIEVLLTKNKDEAFRIIQENRFTMAWILGSDYRFNFLKSDPRYEAMMQAYGFRDVSNQQVEELLALIKYQS